MAKNLIMDISHHQISNKIDWAQASKEVSFAIIRVQYGSRLIDREYKKHVANCKKYGIPFGHYAYGRFVSIDDAKVEANDFLKRIDKDAKFLVLDTEKDTIDSCGTKDVAEASQAFIDVCKKAGHKTGFYVSHHLYKKYGLDKVKADFLWLPRYGSDNGTPHTKPDYDCDLWQYSQKCRVSWYNGGLDLNLLNGDKNLEWFIGEQVVAPKPEAKPTSPTDNKRKKNANGTYTVRSGDTLSEIGSEFKVSVSNLQEWNNIDNKNIIHVGQVLKLEVPKQAKPSSDSFNSYKIRSGDTLSHIAIKYDTTVAELKKINGLKSDLIYAGKTLKVPSKGRSSAPSSSKTYHTVKSGDVVSRLALKYGSTQGQIKSWNDLDNGYTIYVGQKLRVK